MKKAKTFSLFLMAMVVLVLFVSGCATWEGMKQDFQTVTGWDDKFQDVLW